MFNSPAAVVLAAGASSRFGADKLVSLVTVDGHKAPLIVHALRPWLEVFDRVTVVLRSQGETLRTLLLAEFNAPRLDFAVCENAGLGMSASLACGVQANAGAGGWLIGLADMPRVPVSAIAGVKAAIEAGAALAAPYLDSRRGHPIGFGTSYYADLLALSGDQGARSLLQRDEALIHRIETADRGILLDIDQPADVLDIN